MKSAWFLLFLVTSCLSYSQDVNPSDTLNNKFTSGDHELIMMPTAYTMEKGSGYFSSYEIFFLNLTYAFTPTTHIGTFFLFPVTKDFLETFTLGIKQNYLRTKYFQGALWGSFTVKNSFYTAGSVFSFGEKSTSFHLGLGLAGDEGVNVFLILLGGRLDFSSKVSGIIEYTNAKEFLDQDFKGLLTFGIRFKSESTAWEIAGIRPLADTGDLLLIPILKATFFF